jgi:hypothetical protein
VKVKELAEKLDLECICEGSTECEITGCYIGDLLSRVMGNAQPGNVWITIMTNVNVAAVASMTDAACVILAEGVKPDSELAGKFEKLDAALYITPMSSYRMACKIYELIGF